jgi:hypothetical protein
MKWLHLIPTQDYVCFAELHCEMEHKRSLPGVIDKQVSVLKNTARKHKDT